MEDNFCLKTSGMWQLVGYVLFAIKIIVPLIIIVLGIIDFAKASLSSDDKAVSKAASSLLNRFIIGIAVFFVPTVVSIVLGLVVTKEEDGTGIDACRVCLLNPTDTDCDSYKRKAKGIDAVDKADKDSLRDYE